MRLLLAVTLAAMCVIKPISAALFNAHDFTLNNGMRVVVIENHKAPIVKHMVWYKVGAVDEIRGKGGVAHLLEHLMFRGTQKVKDGEFNRLMNEMGAESNAFTSYDVTAYHQLADVTKLEALMALEADRMRYLAFDQKAFAAEQKIVFQERQQVVENNPAAAFNEKMNEMLWGSSPYGQPITGQNDEIKALTYDDARDFYNLYYSPNNAILVLSGDIDAITAKNLAEKYYGVLPTSKVVRDEPEEMKQSFIAGLQMSLPNIQTPKTVWQYLLPKSGNLIVSPYAYLVLAEYLGGGETSALYRDLVEQQRVMADVTVNFSYIARGNSIFRLSAVPNDADDFNAEQLTSSLKKAIENAMTDLTDNKLAQVKRKMTADLVYVNDNPSTAANWVGFMLAVGWSIDDVENYADNVKKVTLSEVMKAYASLKDYAKVEGWLLPQQQKDLVK